MTNMQAFTCLLIFFLSIRALSHLEDALIQVYYLLYERGLQEALKERENKSLESQ